METDQSFHDIFLLQPNWLGPLTGRDIAPIRKAKPAVFKAAKVECDLLFEPEDPAHPDLVVEFQLYYDASIFNRTELARCLRWKELNSAIQCRQRSYLPRPVEAMIIFGDASQAPEHSIRADIPYYFLDQCAEELKKSHPNSPLNALLAPIVSTDSAELAEVAASQYGSLREHPELSPTDRVSFARIYFHLLSQRFKTRTQAEIEVMIAELVPLDQTRVGLDLIDKGRKEGEEKGRKEGEEKGRKEGEEKGRKEGEEKGRKEGIETGSNITRRTFVHRLFARGDSVERISDIVQLPVAEVRQILGESE